MTHAWERKIKEGYSVQSIVFNKRYWNKKDARIWIVENGFSGVNSNEIKFTQMNPDIFCAGSLQEIQLTSTISAIIGIPLRKNRGLPRKTIQFQQVFSVGKNKMSWNDLPIQKSTSTHVYFFMELSGSSIALTSVNQAWGIGDYIAIQGELADLLDLPKKIKKLPIQEQISWWNNHVAMILFNNDPKKEDPLFGRLELNNYYYLEGELFLNTKIYQNDEEISDKTNMVWSFSDQKEELPTLFIEENADESFYIGIQRRYLDSLISKSLK